MTAAMLVLEPIFEADLPPEIYAYRAGRNAQQAAVEVEDCCFVAIRTSWTPTSRTTSGAFRIPTFSKSVARRVVDRHMLHLIKMWLDCPVEEADHRGGKRRTTGRATSGAGCRKAHPSHRSSRTSTCAGLCWAGRSSALSEASALGWSPMPTTS